MHPIFEFFRRRISLAALLGLAIVLGGLVWLVRARAADIHTEPYKYELIEEFKGTKIVRGFIDPVVDMVKVFIEQDGRRKPIDVSSLDRYINSKYEGKSAEEKIAHFVRLYNPSTVKIIESVADIPGFAPDQLDPDINPAAIKTWSFTTNRGKLDARRPQACIVKYAWEGMGDVQRFRFRIYGETNSLMTQEVAVVQTDVGEHGGLD
jgi:hypothetical protein